MTTTVAAPLPPDFADLEPLAAEWSLDSHWARACKRQTSTIEELRAFFEALLPRAEAVLTLLETRQVEDLDPGERRLYTLMLSLAEVAPAVERFGQAKVPYGFDQMRFQPVMLPNLTPLV